MSKRRRMISRRQSLGYSPQGTVDVDRVSSSGRSGKVARLRAPWTCTWQVNRDSSEGASRGILPARRVRRPVGRSHVVRQLLKRLGENRRANALTPRAERGSRWCPPRSPGRAGISAPSRGRSQHRHQSRLQSRPQHRLQYLFGQDRCRILRPSSKLRTEMLALIAV